MRFWLWMLLVRSMNTKVYEHGPSFVSIAMWPGRFWFLLCFISVCFPSNKRTPFNAILCRGPIFPASVCLKELKMFPCPMRLFCIGTRFVQPFWLQIFVVKVETWKNLVCFSSLFCSYWLLLTMFFSKDAYISCTFLRSFNNDLFIKCYLFLILRKCDNSQNMNGSPFFFHTFFKEVHWEKWA